MTATGDCTCQCAGNASGTLCSDSVAVGFNMASCQALAGGTTTVTLGACAETPSTPQSSYNWSPSRVTSGGTCAAAVVNSPIVPAFFSQEERFCESAMTAAGSCTDDEVCTPQIDSGFEGELCIYQEGLHDWPASTYTEKFTRYTGANDERTCDTCSCDGPANNTLCASVTTKPSTSAECFNGIGSAIPANTCIGGNFPAAFTVSSSDLRPFSCTASGGGVVGAATPTGPVTFCCQAP